MLVHEKPVKKNTATDIADVGRHQSAARSERPDDKQEVRRFTRRVVALVTAGVLIGIATIAIIAQPDPGTGATSVSDGSYEKAEANRFARLAPTNTDASHQQAETNRFTRLAPTNTSDGSHEQNECNRFAALRKLASP